MPDRTTTCARRAMRRCKYEAERFGRSLFGAEALLLGLLRESAGAAAGVLRRLGLDLGEARRGLEQALRSHAGPEVKEADAGSLCRESALSRAFQERGRLKSAAFGTPHLLLGVLHDEGGQAARLLRDRGLDPDAVRRAAEEAAALGPDADGGLEAPDKEKSPRAWLAALRDPDAKTRAAAASSLFQAFILRSVRADDGLAWEPGLESEAVPYLVEALRDADVSVRSLAAEILARCGEAARPAVPALVAALRDRAEVRAAAASALAAIPADGEEACAALREALQDSSAKVRTAAARGLWRARKQAEPALPVLRAALSDGDAFLRGQAAAALAEMGAEAAPAVPALTGLLQDADGHVRVHAIHALLQIGPPAGSAVPALVRVMRDPSLPVNLVAAAAVTVLAPSCPEAASALIEALGDPQAQVRQAAAVALGRCADSAEEVVAALRERLGDEAGMVRAQAAWSLWRLGHREGVFPVLAAALTDAGPGVAAHAAHVLGELGKDAAEAVPALRAALAGPNALLRPAAALALWRITGSADEELAVLTRSLRDADWQARMAAAHCLGLMGPAAKAALPALLAARGDEQPFVRRAVLGALAKIEPGLAGDADPAAVIFPGPGVLGPTPSPAGPDRLRRDIDDWTEAIRLDPEDAQAYRCRGQAHRERGDLGQAVADCTEAIRLDPGDERAYFTRGWAHLDAGDFIRATADFTEALRIRPDDVEAYNSRAIARKRVGDFDGAVADYAEALRLRPASHRVHLNRAIALRAARRYAEAVADYEQALRLDPEYAAAYNNLAWLRATCPDAAFRDGRQAVEHACKACELSGFGHPPMLNTLAAAHAEAGDFAEAVRWAKEALARPERLKPADAEEYRVRLRLFEQGKPYRQM